MNDMVCLPLRKLQKRSEARIGQQESLQTTQVCHTLRGGMTRNTVIRILLTALTLCSVAVPSAVAQGAMPTGIRVILVLDMSGSMKCNDPTDLRFTAARMFLSLLDEGDAAGIIIFSTKSQPLTDGLVTIRGPADKVELVGRLKAVPADGWTDVKAVFGDVSKMLQDARPGGRETVVVFLTDGRPEIRNPYTGYESDTLALIRSLGVPVLAIALTSAAQTPFLNRVAAQTGGLVVPADEAPDLVDAYLEILGQIKDRTVIGIGQVSAPGSAPLRLDPALAPYLETASFVVGKPESVAATLLGPGGKEVQPGNPGVVFALLDDPRFAVVTVASPPGGDWKFRLDGTGKVQARAIIRSRLRMKVASPQRFHEAGQPMAIAVHLTEERPDGEAVKIIGQATFSALITRPDGRQESLDQFYDDGTHGDSQAGDGDYTRLYVNTDQSGTYTIVVNGWKGVVPVACTVRVEAVPFPWIGVDEPSAAAYDIRDQSLPLRVHLEGGTPPLLDSGEVVALVTTPSGATSEVVLSHDGGRYTGVFLPAEDGVHEVLFEAHAGIYKGLAYGYTAQAHFEARIIPTVSLRADPLDLGPVEVIEAQKGIAASVPVRSTSRDTETLQIELEGMPGFALGDGQVPTVPPSGSAALRVEIVALRDVSPGSAKGELVFTGRTGMDLEGARVPVRLELFQPTARLSPGVLDLGRLGGCFDCSDRLAVAVECTSRYSETLRLRLEGVSGLSLSPAEVKVQPGATEVTLVVSTTADLEPGEYTARLVVDSRKGLQIKPGSEIPVRFEVAPAWVRCRGYLAGAGVVLVLLLLGAVSLVRRLWAANKPPSVIGTLRHWSKGKPSGALEVDLTALGRRALTVGCGGQADLVVPDRSLEEEHAVLRAEKVMDEVHVVLEPQGKVWDGYRLLNGPRQIHHGDRFTMGSREFQYLSDKGE